MKKSFIVLLVLGIMFLGMTKPLTQLEDLAERLKLTVMENLQLKEERSKLLLQIADYRTKSRDDRIALEPMRYFREVNDIDYKNPYQFDVDHMRYLLKCIDKYEYLLTEEARVSARNDKINIRHFMFSWPAKESHYNPFAKHFCNDETYDRTLYQINCGKNDSIWNHLFKEIPIDVQKIKDPKNNVDVGVCMMYVWINHRVEEKWSWAYLSYKSKKIINGKEVEGEMKHWCWTIYWRLGKIDG